MQRDVERRLRSRSPWSVAVVAAFALVLSVLTVVASPAQPPARAADTTCTISAKLVNSCRPWLGAESGGYGVTGFRNSMLEHENRIGRQLDIVHEYYGTGNVTLSNDVVTLAKRPGTIALVNWRVASKWADGGGSNATVNKQIDAMAASIKALGTTKILLTLHHEPENDISRGGDPNCPNLDYVGSSGTVSDYVAMWHNVRARFDALGINNVVWVMNYMGWKGWNCVVRDLWPGNDYVDWVMWDPYPKTATWTQFVGSFYSYLTANSDATHDFLSKPWGLAEFGYVGSSQTAAYKIYDDAITDLHTGVFPRLKAYVVWDQHTSSSHDDRVGYDENHVADPVEQQHYNAFANDPMMTGNAVTPPTDQTPPSVTRATPDDGGTVQETVSVSGTASDNVGVTSVDLLVDGAVVTSAPPAGDGSVAFDWNSATVTNGSHTLGLRAHDAAGNVGSSAVAHVTVANDDNEAPSPPGGVKAQWGKPSSVTVQWDASTDNGAVTHYRVYRDGEAIATLGPTVRSYVDTGVPNASTLSYTVTALDASDNESAPSEAAEVDTGDDTAPSTPTADAQLTAPDEATVTWDDATDNVAVTGYRVYRNGSLIGNVDASTLSLVDGGRDDGVTYTYRVAAYDAAGNLSALSDPHSVTTPDTTAPTTPTNLKAVSSANRVALTWTGSTDNVGVTNYVVYRDGLPLATPLATDRSYTDNAPDGDTLHHYQVTARDQAGNESEKSNEVVRTLSDTTAPTAPHLTGSLSGSTVRLTWSGATDDVGVTGYTVYRAGVAIATPTAASYTDASPPTGRASSYTVKATDAAGNLSAASNAVSVTVPADKTAPTAPSGLVATAGATGTHQVTLTWKASSDNVGVANYYLYRGNSKYKLLGNVLTYADTGLTAGTKYTYKVYALDAAGNWSSPTSNVSATAR
jgi:fibronectin type 3 domain-containing protein